MSRMIMVDDVIWVICEDYGMEGLRAPLQAFLRQADAENAFALMTAPLGAPMLKLCAVPLWPFRAAGTTP